MLYDAVLVFILEMPFVLSQRSDLMLNKVQGLK